MLLVDIGNTRIKWARFDGRRIGRQRALAYAGWKAVDFQRRVLGTARGIDRIIVASVAGRSTDRVFAEAARRAGAAAPEFIRTRRRAGGVTTAYVEPWRLGVDRFVAVIGAHHLADGRPACVIDVGTAMTLDLVDNRGLHRGGAIVPGPALMIESLLKQTNGIQRRARGAAAGGRLFARTTRTAIEHGAVHAAAAAMDRAVDEARDLVRSEPIVLLTGGAAPAVEPLMRTPHVTVPDLVLHGLAVLAVTSEE